MPDQTTDYAFAGSLLRRIRTTRAALSQHTKLILTYLWRTLMFRTTIIAITGSTGKTTAKECLATILGAQAPTLSTFQNQNDQQGVPRTIRSIRPWHRFAVIEVGTTGPGEIRRSALLLRPDIAIILGLARTHTNRFPTLDDTATEKGALLESVARRGTVILNGDDPRVAAMAVRSRAKKVLFFGRSESCDYRAAEISSRWPDRLSFRLHWRGGEQTVRTQLVGTHWTGSVLASLTAADVCGVSIAAAAERAGSVPPFMGRMQPVVIPCGAVVVRDEENGSPDTLAAMVEVMRESQARRRGLIFSDVSDSRRKPRQRLRDIGRIAAEHCDFVVFVGDSAHHACKGAVSAGMDPARCLDFVSLEDAADWLKTGLREGDLVFLKGRTTDHLSRLLFAQFGTIKCWKQSCRIRRMCDTCTSLQPDFDLQRALRPPQPVAVRVERPAVRV